MHRPSSLNSKHKACQSPMLPVGSCDHPHLDVLRSLLSYSSGQVQWAAIKAGHSTVCGNSSQAPQFLSNCVSTISSSGNRWNDSDCVTRLTTYCREHALSLVNVAFATPVRPPGILCHLTYMTLLTLTYSRNDLKLFCLIMRTDLLLLLYGTPGRFVERRLTNLSLYLYFVYVWRPW